MCYLNKLFNPESRNNLSEQGVLVKKTSIQKAEYFTFVKNGEKNIYNRIYSNMFVKSGTKILYFKQKHFSLGILIYKDA